MSETDRQLDQWRALYETFEVDGDESRVPPLTVEDLDRFESEADIRLPSGYRGYIRVFGPGCQMAGSGKTLREMFTRSPYCPKRSMDLMRAVDRLQNLKSDPPRGMDEQSRRIVVFATDGLGDEFGWDPQDVTDPDAPEFGVYAWYRGDNVIKVSNTFRGFIKLALDLKARSEHKLKQVYTEDADESALGSLDQMPKRVFRPTRRPG